MNASSKPTILIVPGLRSQIADQWQTILEQRLPRARSVAPLETEKLSRAARVAALDSALAQIDGPVILVAHSAGIMITVHWAQQHHRQIHGALLAAPADLDTPMPPGYPAAAVLREHGWLPLPKARLPFHSILVGSENDPLCSAQRAEAFAEAWGSRYVTAGAVGHLNPAAGYGEWDDAEKYIAELAHRRAHVQLRRHPGVDAQCNPGGPARRWPADQN
jgi:predicted alpha/beta hydrolase family esterase